MVHPGRETEQNRRGEPHAKTHNEAGGGACLSGQREQDGDARTEGGKWKGDERGEQVERKGWKVNGIINLVLAGSC